jgi:hypothetical protein
MSAALPPLSPAPVPPPAVPPPPAALPPLAEGCPPPLCPALVPPEKSGLTPSLEEQPNVSDVSSNTADEKQRVTLRDGLRILISSLSGARFAQVLSD